MRQITVKLLKDGSGRVCIHWLIRDPQGPIRIDGRVLESSLGPIRIPPQRWRMACNRNLSDIGVQGGVLQPHSDDVRAVTCPACMTAEEFKKVEAELAELVKV